MHSLSSVHLFEGLEEADLLPLEYACSWRHYSADEMIVSAGRNDSNDLYFVTDGAVRLAFHTRAVCEIIFTNCDAGSFFGEMKAWDPEAMAYSAVALQDSFVAVMPSAIFRQTVNDYHQVNHRLMRYMARKVRHLMLHENGRAEASVEQRIFSALLRIAEPSHHGDGVWLIPRLPSHQEIASLCRATEKIVSGAIAHLIRSGLARRKNTSLYILDHSRLRQLADAS